MFLPYISTNFRGVLGVYLATFSFVEMKMKRINIVIGLVLLLSLNCYAGLQPTTDVSRQRSHWLNGISVFDTTGMVDDQHSWDSLLESASDLSLATIDADAHDSFLQGSPDGTDALEFIELKIVGFFDAFKSMGGEILSSIHFMKIT